MAHAPRDASIMSVRNEEAGSAGAYPRGRVVALSGGCAGRRRYRCPWLFVSLSLLLPPHYPCLSAAPPPSFGAMFSKIAGLAVLLGCCKGMALMKVSREEASAGAAASSAFLLVAGVTSSKEMCLASTAGHAALEPCVEALAAGDGAT